MKKQIKKLLLTVLVYAPIVSISFAARSALAANSFDDQEDLELIRVDNKIYRVEELN